MGIHGIYKELGSGTRISLAKLSADHYIQHSRCFRLAIDISIWLFQIQSGKGGSNPALRTFYYRLLRLLSLNIHPLFVFDGPKKPLFKRHKRVGGGNFKVSSIPEFLAKQLLKQFGFPWHVAPGEAEAECALLQREGVVDAVLSEDVDTLMFGSGITLKSWTPELKSSKVPTHVNVYRAEETKEGSGLDREGMILVALMSGGDYIPEGIPGCGPKLACDAARAGFGRDLVALKRKDAAGLRMWRERLQYQIQTNEAKLFSRRKPSLNIPEDFPSQEVLGYYTHPCVSGPDKLARLKESIKWDLEIDFASLRTFAADAFDWRCLGGAKKFIRNLAPALLVRELRLRSESGESDAQNEEERETAEARMIERIHGKRQHATTDNTLELRISFIPLSLVDIDLSIEDPDEEIVVGPESDSESEAPPSSTQDDAASSCPCSPRKVRAPSAYDPAVPEKVWILDTFLKLGCPMKVQDWEASQRDPRELLKARGNKNVHAKRTGTGMQQGAIEQYGRVSKAGRALKELSPKANSRSKPGAIPDGEGAKGFVLPSSQHGCTATQSRQVPRKQPAGSRDVFSAFTATKAGLDWLSVAAKDVAADFEEVDLTAVNNFASTQLAVPDHRPRPQKRRSAESPSILRTLPPETLPSTPRRKAKQAKVAVPDPSQPTIIDLLSSPAKPPASRPSTPTPPNIRHIFIRSPPPPEQPAFRKEAEALPPTVTKRRRKESPLKRHQSAPVVGSDGPLPTPTSRPSTPSPRHETVEAIDLAISSPASLPSPSALHNQRDDEHATPRAMRALDVFSSPRAKAPATISEWIRQGQSVTPGKVRHVDVLGLQSSRQTAAKEKRKLVQLRASLEGGWREVDAVDLTGDGDGWRASRGTVQTGGWRRSGIEMLDLTGI